MNLRINLDILKKISLTNLMASIYLLWLNGGFLSYVLYRVSIRYLHIVFFIWLCLVLQYDGRMISRLIKEEKLIIYFLCLALIYNFLWPDPNINGFRSGCIVLMEIIAICTYYFKHDNFFAYKVCKFILADDAFIILRTLYYLQKNPYLSRQLHVMTDLTGRTNTSGVSIIANALMDYPLAYAFIFVGLYFFYLSLSESKVGMLLLSVFMIYVEIRTGFLISVLLIFLGYFLYILHESKNRKMALLLLIIIIIGICLSLFLPEMLSLAAQKVSSIYSKKLLEIRAFIVGGFFGGNAIGDMGSRFELYVSSINSFLKYPFFGVFSTGGNITLDVYGGHSTVLDLLAGFGITVIPYFLFWGRKLVDARLIENHSNRSVVLTGYILFMVIGIVNTNFTGKIFMYVLFVLPSLVMYREEKKTVVQHCLNNNE